MTSQNWENLIKAFGKKLINKNNKNLTIDIFIKHAIIYLLKNKVGILYV